MIQKRLKNSIFLNLLMLIYSLSPICSKMASREPIFSIRFFMFYGAGVAVLGIYALLWQQVIKHIPLTVAYANKAVTVVWGMVWGTLFFNEQITFSNIVGAVMIIAGVVLFVLSDSNGAEKETNR